MTRSVILILITLSVFTACTTDPSGLETTQPSIVIDDSVVDTAALLADKAYISDDKLFIRFRHRSETIDTFTILPEQDETVAHSSTTLYLQKAVEQFNDLPLAQLSYIEHERWTEQTQGSQTLPVAGVALWREFRDRLFANITPREPGTGIVVEFLKQEELFFYYDEHGLLHSVPLHEKPAELSTDDTFKFSELIYDATPLLSEYIIAASGAGAPAVLFNTGDTADYGYPFIYANHDSGQIVFLRRMPRDSERCQMTDELAGAPMDHTLDDTACSSTGTGVPQGVVHATRSHTETFLRQPIGSVARLFILVSHKIVDTITPKTVAVLQAQPIPPVSNGEPMDAVAWERELNDLVFSPLSQGSIEYLVDGEEFFPRLVDAIQAAEESIDIRVYIFDNDDYALKIASLLKKRSEEIRVRILIDGLGTITAASATSASTPEEYEPPPKIISYLKSDSDIEVRTVLNPWLTGDHTKTILIDNKIAYLGGMNIGREYRYDWHDMMVEIRGPIVDEIQTNFEKAWRLQSFLGDIRAALYHPDDPVNEAQPGQVPIRLLFTKPGDSQILRSQLAAITRARQRIYIQNAYFTSDDIIFELVQARRRGVDVRIIMPYQSDSGIIDRSNVRAINTMLENGIRVYVYPGESHIKGAVYDGWICLGSANFDQLSLRMNKELNIATSSPVAVQGFLDEIMLPDFEKSVELKEQLPKKWSDFLMETIADQL